MTKAFTPIFDACGRSRAALALDVVDLRLDAFDACCRW